MPEIVIVDAAGAEHHFPDGFDPKRAIDIVRGQTATPAPTAVDSSEPGTYFGGAIKGFKEGAAGGAKGFAQGLKESPMALVQGLATMFTQNPVTTMKQQVQAVGRLPAAIRASATDPEGWGRDVGRLTGTTELGLAAPKLLTVGGKAAVRAGGAAADTVSPDVVGIVSPRVANTLRVLQRLRNATAKTQPAGGDGRLVPGQPARPIEQEMADAIAEVRASTASPRITTPPEPQLPAGYTPRATVPRAPTPKPAAPAAAEAAPKRAYFLKSLDEMGPLTNEPVTPLGRPVGVGDLPQAWRSRVGQSMAKPDAALSSDAAAELTKRGLSPEAALEAIAKDPTLSPSARLQLRQAILQQLR